MTNTTTLTTEQLANAKRACAEALAAYSSPTGRASAKAVDGWMRADLSSLVRMCQQRGLRPLGNLYGW